MTDNHFLLNRRTILAGAGAGALAALTPRNANAVLRLEINQGNPQPMPIALPDFLGGAPSESDVARNVTGVISNNLARSGLFAPINPQAFTEKITNSDAVPRFPDWRRSACWGRPLGSWGRWPPSRSSRKFLQSATASLAAC